MHLPKSNHSTIISISFLILLAVIFILLMVFGRSVFIPVIIAIVIWFLIMDMTENIQRIKIAGRHIPRRLAMSLGIILIVFVSVRVARLFYVTSLDLLTDIPSYQQNINTLLEAIPDYVWTMIPSSDEERFSSDIDRLLALATEYFSAYIASLAGNVVNIIIQSALTLIYVIFLLLEQNTFATKIDNMFPNPKRRAEMKTILDSIKQQVQRYVSNKTFVSV
ncbi:MAG: AI-2E family transporter, partial [Anaerolineae bacterium]|nr:AI-2E family transporter [Anaerolineae bacterium]